VIDDGRAPSDDPDGQQHGPEVVERSVPARTYHGQGGQQVQAAPTTTTTRRAPLPSNG
jgi:hypothetical protein